MEKMSQQEEQAMQAIWKTGEGNIKSFLENMLPPIPPYTTLASTIKNLEKKGYLKSRVLGNMYFYKPILLKADYKKQFIKEFVSEYFADSYKELVNFFVTSRKINQKELKEIIELIERDTESEI